MKKLLTEYEFNTVEQYYEMVRESYTNGQITQAKMQFNAMPRANRIEFIKELTDQKDNKKERDFFIDML